MKNITERQTFFLVITIIFVGLILSSCKKYPENNLWFKAPKNAMLGKWKLELLTVNGTDSTSYDDVKMYVEEGIELFDEDIKFKEQYEGGWKLDQKKKNVTINSASYDQGKLFVPQKNLFRDNQTWKIEKLSKSAFWLSVTNGGSTYEIRFKN
ncbi:MAG: hypothetical protein KA163_09300 [Bacteroidia bacterium]|nr:hypothetical protein [Bacteroidia bacterium]